MRAFTSIGVKYMNWKLKEIIALIQRELGFMRLRKFIPIYSAMDINLENGQDLLKNYFV